MMIACVCMCGAEVCGLSGDVEWCECECGCLLWVCVCVCRWWWVDVCEVWCLVCCVVCVSLSRNRLDAEGGAAMAGALQHLTSLTTLRYVWGWMV
jgi:hypothetical protein